MWNVWSMTWSRVWSNAKANEARPPFQGFVKVKKWVLAHSHILSCCLSVSPSAIASFHSLAHILTHILVRLFQARWIQTQTSLTSDHIFKHYRFWLKPDSASPQTARTAKLATGCSGSSRELGKMSRTTELLLSGKSYATFIERHIRKQNHSCQVIIMSLSLKDTTENGITLVK